MTKPESLSKRAELRFWGWGYADDHLSLKEDQLVEAMVAVMAPNSTEVAHFKTSACLLVKPGALKKPGRFKMALTWGSRVSTIIRSGRLKYLWLTLTETTEAIPVSR